MGPGSTAWIAADLAALAEGAVVVPLYPELCADELGESLLDADPRAILCGDRALLRAAGDSLGTPLTLTFDELFEGPTASGSPVPRQADDPVTIIYTAGTTGRPRGAILTRGNIEHALEGIELALADGGSLPAADQRVFHPVSLCFAGSRLVVWSTLGRAGTVMSSQQTEHPQRNDVLCDELMASEASSMIAVPAQLERLRSELEERMLRGSRRRRRLYARARAAFAAERDGTASATDRIMLATTDIALFRLARGCMPATLRFIVSSSAPLRSDTQLFFQMIGLPVGQIYGLTEATAVVTVDEPHSATAGRVGHLVRGVEARIAEGGELLIRGPNVFAGYFRRPDATRDALTDGWLRSGDRVEVDHNGIYRVIGRTNDLLIPSSGHNIAPEPIEKRLVAAIGGIEHAIVFGHGRPYLTAVLSGTADRLAVAKEIDAINRTLPYYRRIRAFHITGEAFSPINGLLAENMKPQRMAVEERYRLAIERLYS